MSPMSISFIWYQLFWIGASDEAYVTSGKSGLNLNALDLLISVLSTIAVLGCAYNLTLVLSFITFWRGNQFFGASVENI